MHSDSDSRRVTGMACLPALVSTCHLSPNRLHNETLAFCDSNVLYEVFPGPSHPARKGIDRSTDTDRDSDTDSQVYDLHVVYACINLENSRAVSPLAKGSNTTTVVVCAVENKMIFYKASLLYIAAGLCRIIQLNLCIAMATMHIPFFIFTTVFIVTVVVLNLVVHIFHCLCLCCGK